MAMGIARAAMCGNRATGRAAAYWTPSDSFSLLAAVDFVRARDCRSPFRRSVRHRQYLAPIGLSRSRRGGTGAGQTSVNGEFGLRLTKKFGK